MSVTIGIDFGTSLNRDSNTGRRLAKTPQKAEREVKGYFEVGK